MLDTYNCWRCGKEIQLSHEPRERLYCDECFEAEKKEHNVLIEEYSKLKIKVMHDNALRLMEKSGKSYMYEYRESSERILKNALSNTETFMSSHEMVVAMVLDNCGIYYEPNFGILRYKVDFYIPEFKVCVEVDGNLHDHKLEYDSRRDIAIREVLGKDWEVIRIKTKYIEENPERIIDAIEALASEKRRLRRKNCGVMPYGFSKRENVLYDSVTK